MRKFLLLCLFIIGAASTSNLFAQGVTTASIHGVVTDSKGGTLPGATVIVTHLPTGTVYSAATRADGRYNLANLRVGGPYTFKISFIGFKDYTQDNITLSIGQDLTLNTKLEDNSTTLKEVTVAGAGGKVINSSRTGARETVTRAQIEALPTINRSLQDYTKLTPSANGLSFGGRSGLYNNITVDGALFNNSFGLSTTLGGQTSSQPISLDAIDQIQVDIAPYDVRQGNFTGAGVNTVVKSGTNQLKATAYYYVRGTSLTGYQAGTTGITVTPFTYHTVGASIGGAILPNKLFLFVSGEQERISAPAHSFVANSGQSGSNVSQVKATDLDALTQYLKTTYNYDPGPYQGFNYQTYSDKLTTKLDWNINKNNTLSAKYFYLKSYKDQPPSTSSTFYGSSSRFAGTTGLPYFGSGYRINNNFNIGILELDTRVSNTMSNRLTAGYSALRDFRSSLSSTTIPMVDIGNGTSTNTGVVTSAASGTATSFGYEQFTAGNLLSSNIWQFSDDFTIYAGKHEITIGTNDQIQSYVNGFATQYNGVYAYNSFSDFENGLPAASYTYRYSALPDGSFPYARIKGAVYAAYVQDKFQVNDNFKLTYGIRADYDVFPTTLQQNANVPPLTFQGGTHVDPAVLPSNKLLVSPRVGFNWDVKGDQSTQIRGGSGIFAGAVPFVWISNQASNNGVLFGSYQVTKSATPADPRLIFNPNVDANRPAPGAGAANTSYELDIADPNLKLPEIWRTNLAIDQKLPGGFIGTIEAAYTKDINAIYHKNLVLSDGFVTLPGTEGQIRYNASNTTGSGTLSAANPKITGLYYMTNTSAGYSYFVTAQLQKNFLNGFYANAAYTYSQSKDVNDGGSTASTIWSTRYVAGNPNADNISNSSFVQPNRIIASLAYRKEYAKNFATSIGLTMESANNGAISYLTSGDPNGDGASNDLMFIPQTSSDILLVPDFVGDTRTAAQEWSQLDKFISQDPYLSKHRGQFAERNGAILPYFQLYNLNLTQDFYIKSGKSRNTLRFTFDIINLGNFLDPNWGLSQVSAINGAFSGGVTVLSYKGIDATTGRPTYSFPYLDKTNLVPVTVSYKNDSSQFSRWQAQFGIRYIFN
ncbi:TonB-dependent receptor [Mucilaginibacter sp. PPCGB 2223]|uniref:TonB-dependent receptor n=1 Tax=Mucilaginibacter sp. PPCGB 2223 TaxID=1886027 RepID=UPI000825D51B|nr:carboxypeptidase regulatory-like domain-containing protein [Mucilaginibacter sp. PPCGB 2223]OCX54498.1 TonB-dependent receptor [Mucilaginibacter sp. PPCGB 2223]